jgi:hypothetical protein
MGSFEKKDRFDQIVKWGLIAVVALMVSKLLWINIVENKLSDYLLAETLLYYPGKYIRRSLLGNIFLPFSATTQKALIVLLYSLMVVMLIWYSLKYCRDKYLLLLYLCVPFGIRIYLSENNGLYRKELLFFLVIILALQLYRRSLNQTVNLVVSIVASVLMIMIHESFVFLAVPVMGWIIYKNNAGLLKLCIYFIVTMASFLLLSVDPTEQQIATLDQFFLNRQIDWSLSRNYFVMSKEKGLSISFSHFMEGSIWFFLLFFLPLIAYLFYTRIIKKEFGLLLCFQALGTLVLCIIAMDYGRWLSFMLLSFFLCFFTYDHQEDFRERIRRSNKEKILYAAMILFVCAMHIPNYVDSHPLKRNIKENLILKKVYDSVK